VEDKPGEEKLGKEAHYKHLEHGLVAGSRYAMKGPGTYKGRSHTMVPRAMTTVTFKEHRIRIRKEDTRHCGGDTLAVPWLIF